MADVDTFSAFDFLRAIITVKKGLVVMKLLNFLFLSFINSTIPIRGWSNSFYEVEELFSMFMCILGAVVCMGVQLCFI